MAKAYTDHFKEETGSTSGQEPVYLLEITHPQLATPVRLVNDTEDLIHNSNTYFACAFRVHIPEDVSKVVPQAPLVIDNIGRELTQFLEQSFGGRGAQVTIKQVMRDTPTIIEQEYILSLLNVKQTMLEVTGQLGYENYLDVPALTALYTPEAAPGLF